MARRLTGSTAIIFMVAVLVVFSQVSVPGRARQSFDEDGLRQQYERYCDPKSNEYGRNACGQWVDGLTDEEREYLDYAFVFSDARESDVTAQRAGFPQVVGAATIDRNEYQGIYQVDRYSISGFNFLFKVTHRWCSNSEGTKLKPNCFWSIHEHRESFAWDWKGLVDRPDRTTNDRLTQSRLVYLGQFKGATVAGAPSPSCYPLIDLTVRPVKRGTNLPTYTVNDADDGC